MIQTGHPAPTFGESDPNTLRPPGAGRTVSPEAIGMNVAPGRMGDNGAATQNGPLNQGAASIGVKDQNMPPAAAQTDTLHPDDVFEQLAGDETPPTTVANQERPVEYSTQMSTPGQADGIVATNAPSADASSNPVELVNEKAGYELSRRKSEAEAPETSGTTIQAAQEDTVISHIQAASSIRLTSGFRSPEYLARLMMNGQIVHFRSHEEKATVEEEAKKIAERRSQHPNRQNTGQTKTSSHIFGGISAKSQRNLIEKLVAGKHRGLEYLQDASKQKDWQYNIMKTGFLNDTYLHKDSVRFVNKVRSLLPAAHVATDKKSGNSSKPAARAKA